MLTNPYTPGQIPRILAGRTTELSLIRDRLARVEAYGELSGPLLVFHAPRGVGKTSLLREAQREAEEHGFVTVWVACARRQPLLPELVDRVGNALEAAEVVTGRATGPWRARMQRLSLQVGPPGVQVGAEITRERETGPEPTAPVAAIEDLLHEAATKVRTRGGSGLAVFVDELHAAMRADAAILLNALQNLDGRREDNPLTVIGAGLPSTPEELTRAATFGERTSFVGLQPPGRPGARSRRSSSRPSCSASPGTTAPSPPSSGRARGYPYFLQLLAHAAWQAATPDEGDRVTAAHVRKGRPAAEQQLQAMYRARWRAATPLEQDFMAAMAGEADASTEPGEEPAVARGAVAARMGRTSRAVSMPRDRLLDKGIIESAGHGLLRFTLPGFTDYVRTQGAPSD